MINSEKYTAVPLFLGEVNIYLKKRYENSQYNLNTEFSNPVNQKLLRYCREMCFFEKKKVKELRRYINESILEETLTCEDRIQAEIILCKLIDLDLISFKVATILLPGFKKYFKMNLLHS